MFCYNEHMLGMKRKQTRSKNQENVSLGKKKKQKDVVGQFDSSQYFDHILWLVILINVIQNDLKTRQNCGRLSCFNKILIPNYHDVVITTMT